jgi:purine-nucleoside phosphorylase
MDTQYTFQDYSASADYIREHSHHRASVGLILGSGLSGLAQQIEDADVLEYAKIPHFPISTVAGHAGRLVIGKLAGVAVCAMQGRFHYYEGYSMQSVTLPIRVMQRLGINTLILTNAAGGLNPAFEVGDIMLIEDHINFVGMAGVNPLRGPNLDEFGPRFPAVNRTYTPYLRRLAKRVAAAQGVPLQQGVYAVLSGPNFESPAEIRMLRLLGVDAVGMSTVPEALVAHHAGIDVLALSTITNVAVAELDAAAEPSHEEVIDAGKVIVPKLAALLLGVLTELAQAGAQEKVT